MKKIITIAAIALALHGCVSYNGNADQAKSSYEPSMAKNNFEILKQEQYGGRETEATIVIKSQAELNALYESLGQEAAPTVDFTNRNVVVLFMGQKNTGGYGIGVKSVTVDANTAIVSVERTQPSGMATMALSAPYCIASIPKAEKTEFR